MVELPSISVVVPCYQSGNTLGATLDSILAQKYQGDIEIIVVRTGPDDGADEVARTHPGIRLITRSDRFFAGPARNIGAEKATGSLLAFLDADCIPGEGWALSLAKARELGVKAQGGAIETHPPKTLGARAEEFLETLEFHPRGSARPLAFASAANSAYDAELFRTMGGFPSVKLGEDLLLGEQLRQRGIPISFNPEMTVLHCNHVPLAGFFAKQREHGAYSAWVRRQAEMSGSVFVRHPWLIPLLAPARMARLSARAIRISPSLLPALALLSPLLAAGIAAWTVGFVRGVSQDPPLEVNHG